jgi:hypothetical protein
MRSVSSWTGTGRAGGSGHVQMSRIDGVISARSWRHAFLGLLQSMCGRRNFVGISRNQDEDQGGISGK